MVPLRLGLVCVLGVLLVVPHAATAGGWWSYVDVNRSHVAPGQRVEIDEAVCPRSRLVEGGFGCRLLPGHAALAAGNDPLAI